MEKLKGTGVALVTPFTEDFEVDYNALNKLIKHVSDGGVEYLVVLGTTGESATIAPDERHKIIEHVIAANEKNLPLVLGYGSNNTKTLITAIEQFKDYPFDALLSVSPYYNRPSQEGIIQHYSTLADNSPFPVILYNVPPRTSSNLTAETTVALAEHKNIIGTKEAAGDLLQIANIKAHAPEDFLVISGEDALTMPMLSMGAHGAISVLANLQPKPFSEMVRLGLKGDFKAASKLHFELLEGYHLVSEEGNPVSLKTGLEAAGISDRRVRLPLYAGSDELLSEFEDYLKIE